MFKYIATIIKDIQPELLNHLIHIGFMQISESANTLLKMFAERNLHNISQPMESILKQIK